MFITVTQYEPRDARSYTFTYDNEEDFITEVGAEAWEQGHCIDADDFDEALRFAKEDLEWQVIVDY